MGSATALPRTGNVLVGYVFMFLSEDVGEATWATRLSFKGWSRIREFTRTTPPKVVWEVPLHARETSGRTPRLPGIGLCRRCLTVRGAAGRSVRYC